MRKASLYLTLSTCLVGASLLVPLPAFAQDAAKGDAKADGKVDLDTEGKADAPKKKDPSDTSPPPEKYDVTDVEEVPGRTYFFVGLRYRGNVIPAFLLNLFLDEGKTIYTNLIGVEFDVRKDGFSIIPAISYHEIGTGDILFKQKGTKDIAGNYSVVNSGMKVVYGSVDLMWSSKISKNLDFEYGAGFGVGAVFGDLENTWVFENNSPDKNGSLLGDNGKWYKRCEVGQELEGCRQQDHQDAAGTKPRKVGGYKEPSWFDGGSKPAIFPWISLPQFGLRIKPVKNFVGRIGVGVALTGFWFGFNGSYGLEKERK